MRRVDAAIMFASEHQYRRVIGLLHVMVWRVVVERLELFGIFHGAELGGVESAVRVEFDAQHVIDADVRNDRANQIRALCQERAHEQAAIAASLNRKPGWLGVIGSNQKLSAGGEIIENVLLV